MLFDLFRYILNTKAVLINRLVIVVIVVLLIVVIYLFKNVRVGMFAANQNKYHLSYKELKYLKKNDARGHSQCYSILYVHM